MKQIAKRFITIILVMALVLVLCPTLMRTEVSAAETLRSDFNGLTAEWENGRWIKKDTGYEGSASSSDADGCVGVTYIPTDSRFILTNVTDRPADIFFSYSLELNGGFALVDGINVTNDGDFSKSMDAGSSITVRIVSSTTAANTTKFTLTELSFAPQGEIRVTFAAPDFGSYTVDGQTITEDTEFSKEFDLPYVLSVTPQEGYSFLGWYNETKGIFISYEASDRILLTSDCTIYPYFYVQGDLQFKVGNETFNDLNAADKYASSHGNETIILINDGLLPAGNYQISRGNTLLIPFDSEYTLYTAEPETVEEKTTASNTRPFRTLTMAPGANLSVFGSLSLSAKQSRTMGSNGSTVGDYGAIVLQAGSSISVNNGGKLYCWGYISGSGNVYANNGSVVYEPFQITDFRGGTATLAMDLYTKVFPINQYYIQNIEAPITYAYGAKEITRSVIGAGSVETGAPVPFLGVEDDNPLFILEQGAAMTKRYDAAADRCVVELEGSAALKSVSLSASLGENSFSINSADLVVPLGSNFDVRIHSGTTTISQDAAVLPDAILTIDDGAQMLIPEGVNVYVYDSDVWGYEGPNPFSEEHEYISIEGFAGSSNVKFCPVKYVTSGAEHIRNPDTYELKDAKLDINGKIIVEGRLYTTAGFNGFSGSAGGADITSSEGTGRIIFSNAEPIEKTVTYQAVQYSYEDGKDNNGKPIIKYDCMYAPISVTSAKLHNGSDYNGAEYTATTGACGGQPFSYQINTWDDAPLYDISFSVSGTVDSSLTMPDVNSVTGTELWSSVLGGPQGYTFAGWSETPIEGESLEAEVLTGNYAPQSDVTLYAVFSRAYDGYTKVTQQPETLDGTYLIVCETNQKAFNGNAATTYDTGNYLPVTITDGKIPFSDDLAAADVEIKPVTDDTYSIHSAEKDRYFGHTGGSGAGINANKTTVYQNTITIDANGFAAINNAAATNTGTNTYNFLFNSSTKSDRFGFYKSTASSYYRVCLYQKNVRYYTTHLDCEHQSYTQTVTAPTCTERGYTTNICTNCGYSWETVPTNPTGHTYTPEVTEPTQTEQGFTTYTCELCGATYITDYTDPLGVNYTVTYSMPNNTQYTQTINSVSGGELPTEAPEAAGYIFCGWSETQIDPEESGKIVLTGNYKPTGDVSLYAVYSRAEKDEGSGDYRKVVFGDPIFADGKYLVVNEEAAAAMDGSLDNGIGTNNNTVAVEITEGVIAASAELNAAAVTFNPIFGTPYYSVQLDSGRYIGNLGSSAGINSRTKTPYENQVSVTGSNTASILNVSDKATYGLRYNDTNSKFSFYKISNNNNSAKDVALYYKAGSGVTLYYTTAPVPCEHDSYISVPTAATCTEAGYLTNTCGSCGYVWTETTAAALGHAYDGGTVTAPSAENGYIGYTAYTCSRCGDSYQDNFVGIDFKVSYNVLGTESEPVTVNSCNGVMLPSEVTEVFGYEFCGWSTAPINSAIASAQLLSGEYHPTGDVTLYAVYTRYAESDHDMGDYVRIDENTDFASGGMILIVYEDESVAFSGIQSEDGAGGKGNYIPVNIGSGNLIVSTEDVDEAAVAVKPIAGTGYYTMQISNGKYIGSTGSSTGINQNNKSNYRNAMILDANYNGVIENVDGKNQYQLMFNTNGTSDRFGFYKTTGSGAKQVALYYRIGSEFALEYTTNPEAHVHEYEIYDSLEATCTAPGHQTHVCLCGDSFIMNTPALGHDYQPEVTRFATCTVDGILTYTCSRCSHSYEESIPAQHDPGAASLEQSGNGWDSVVYCLECGEEISREPVIRIESAALRLDEDIDVIYTAKVPENATASMTFAMNGNTVTVADDGTHSFAFEGVNPQCMGDNISAELTVTIGGISYPCEKAEYSVRTYCLNTLADKTISDATRRLVSDVLAYGAASQTYMSYKTDNLVTTDAAGASYSTYSDLSGLAASFSGTAAEDICWVGAGLTLTNNVAMNFRFYAEDISGLSVNVTVNGRTQSFTEFTAVSGLDKVYEISFKGIKATEFDSAVTASFYKSNAQIGNTLSYSVNTYVCAKQADSNTALAALVKALYNYGASAAAFHN